MNSITRLNKLNDIKGTFFADSGGNGKITFILPSMQREVSLVLGNANGNFVFGILLINTFDNGQSGYTAILGKEFCNLSSSTKNSDGTITVIFSAENWGKYYLVVL